MYSHAVPFADFACTLPARLQSHGDVYHMVDPVITTVATISSIGAGMWRLNGTPAAGQAFIYHHFHLCPSLKRHDLLMLQSACCTIDDPGRITMAMLQRFDLTAFADNKDQVDKKMKTEDFEDLVHKKVVMVEAFLQIILAVVMERHVHFVGKVLSLHQLVTVGRQTSFRSCVIFLNRVG